MKNQIGMGKDRITKELPIIAAILMVYTVTVFFQNSYNWNIKSIGGFSIVIALHIGMYFYRIHIFKDGLWAYFITQGIIIFALSAIIKINYQAAYLGLIPLIIAQSIQLLKDARKIIYAITYYYIIYIATIILYKGFHQLLYSISLLMLISTAISAYGYFYMKKVRDHEYTQRLLFELETAYDKLEQITREGERQILARDIHDTLSQGLAGALMKLEALSANLHNESIDKCKIITKALIIQTRETLKESREIIHELRLQNRDLKDLGFTIDKEIEMFKLDCNLEVVINRSGNLEVTDSVNKNISYIVRESLTNIKKHAKASRVNINITLERDKIIIRIEDNGIGFDYLHFNRLYGHYGIIGLKERAKAVGGELQIESNKRIGTCITLIVHAEMLKEGVSHGTY